jgi:hypothetical protein
VSKEERLEAVREAGFRLGQTRGLNEKQREAVAVTMRLHLEERRRAA